MDLLAKELAMAERAKGNKLASADAVGTYKCNSIRVLRKIGLHETAHGDQFRYQFSSHWYIHKYNRQDINNHENNSTTPSDIIRRVYTHVAHAETPAALREVSI